MVTAEDRAEITELILDRRPHRGRCAAQPASGDQHADQPGRITRTPEIREPHKCTELVWADPDQLPMDTLEFIAPAWNDAQNGRVLREFGFTPVPA